MLIIIIPGSLDSIVGTNVACPASKNISQSGVYQPVVNMFFELCALSHPLDALTSKALLNFGFHLIPNLWGNGDCQIPWRFSSERFRKNVTFGLICYFCVFTWLTPPSQIPQEFRRQIIRRTYNPIVYLRRPKGVSWRDVYILGCGKNRVVCCWSNDPRFWHLVPYPAFSDIF